MILSLSLPSAQCVQRAVAESSAEERRSPPLSTSSPPSLSLRLAPLPFSLASLTRSAVLPFKSDQRQRSAGRWLRVCKQPPQLGRHPPLATTDRTTWLKPQRIRRQLRVRSSETARDSWGNTHTQRHTHAHIRTHIQMCADCDRVRGDEAA